MSRLQHNYQPNDILTNCETYMSKLLKRKPDKPRIKVPNRPLNQLARMSNAKNSIVPYTTSSEKNVPSGDDDCVHKEIINNNKLAQVEVTVRTVSGRSRSRSNSCSDRREPWAKILTSNQDGENRRNLDYALGTIHYLSKELQRKLHLTCPAEPSIHQLVNDIQNTLYRLGPEIVSIQNSQENMETEGNTIDNINKEAIAVKTCQGTQTINPHPTTDYDDYLKMETYCKKIEQNCETLKSEKDKVTNQLKQEKTMVEKLKQELAEQFTEKNDKTVKLLIQMQTERDVLADELKSIKINKNVGSSTNELKNVVEKLRVDNSLLEYENLNLKYEMTIMKLEKEKTSFLLESRDKHLKALRNEIETIQNVICSQLIDIKSDYGVSTLGRGSLESLWKSLERNKKSKTEQTLQELFLSKPQFENIQSQSTIKEPMLYQVDTGSSLKSRLDFPDEYPQRDVSNKKTDIKQIESRNVVATSDATLNSDNMEDLESNIKEMFAELKRQANEAVENQNFDK